MSSDYTMKIPSEMVNVIKRYIEEFKELGYRTVSKFILHNLHIIVEVLIDKLKEREKEKEKEKK